MTEKIFLPYALQSISQEDIHAVSQALAQPVITRGELVAKFEETIAKECDAKFAVAFNSGSTALLAAYYAGQVGPLDTVISTPNTFVATVGSCVQFGANPLFVDIDRKTGNIDLNQVALNLQRPRSRGRYVVVPVHFSGIPVDMQRLDAMILDPNTLVIEDAAHAIGSRYKDGTKVGSCQWSQMTILSFHPAKTMTTGEGGMVTTNDEELYRRLKSYRNNGIERDPIYMKENPGPWFYEVNDLSSNFNFTEMQAALGLSQYNRLGNFIEKRQSLVKLYEKELQGVKHIRLFEPDEGCFVAPHLFVVQIDFEALKKNRADFMKYLKENGIGTQVHYIPVYRFPYFFHKFGDLSPYFPEMESYYQQALSLPLYYDLSEDDVRRVVQCLKNYFS